MCKYRVVKDGLRSPATDRMWRFRLGRLAVVSCLLIALGILPPIPWWARVAFFVGAVIELIILYVSVIAYRRTRSNH